MAPAWMTSYFFLPCLDGSESLVRNMAGFWSFNRDSGLGSVWLIITEPVAVLVCRAKPQRLAQG